MYRYLLVIPVFLAFSELAGAQATPDYKSRMGQIMWNIQKNFYEPSTGLFIETNGKNDKPHSYLWPLCALIQAADEVETVLPGRQYLKPVLGAIEQYHNTEAPAPGYQAYVTKEGKDSRFYDDNQWIGIACMDAYNRTADKSYLAVAEEIYRFQMTGYDMKAGGGLYWKEDEKNTKNTCSNGPGILLALQLYKITKDKQYLETGVQLYEWTKKNLRSPEGLYYDAIKVPGLKIDSAKYTYNTGTMLQSTVLLYNLTGDQRYLEEAKLMAEASKKYFYKNGRLPDHYWFNVVLLRGFEELYKVDKTAGDFQMFTDDAERIWKDEKDETGLLGRKPVKSLIDQAAMLEMFGRLERLEK
ncbi:glycoside hydrolase family 76 protein [Dyadobacter sp. CY323]|uniref:glycoside hydrolase family 76 protein n=1 Tax=Dyadobacter sp. CY323 TaxID=2907302 RepID=UPI001F3B6CCA|nr:glycoside hydrolase family 76 protein [Dyadobacter sp. CY323]MCE6989332.1 glycoside hydrolase family 88 protein [Dyadobacter sp. CY323]